MMAAGNGPGGSLPRRADLDAAKGLAIILVVLGHLVSRSHPAGNDWYLYLQTALYQFHMPFLMYLSGYVHSLSGAARSPAPAWPRFVLRRGLRLLVPFGAFGLAVIVGKLVASQFISVDNPPASFVSGVVDLVWHTDHSPALSVWYMAVLFTVSVLTPPLLWVARGHVAVLVAVSVAAYLVHVPHVMFLDRVARFALFFVTGVLVAGAGTAATEAMRRFSLLSLAVFLALLAACTALFDDFTDAARLALCGLASIPALHGLIIGSSLGRSRWLLVAGGYSFVIYLLNTPFIGAAKGLLLKVTSWDGPIFPLFAAVLFSAGLLGPVFVKRLLLPARSFLDRITD